MSGPKRIQMSRQRPWRAENPDAVIVARPSRWGNPFKVQDGERAAAVAKFREFVEMNQGMIAYDQWRLSTIRAELAGKDLACWCPLSEPCHADVLLELANA